jgi:E3 ubiquitin-protein ligase ATL41
MSYFVPATKPESGHRTTTTGTAIFGYICISLTGTTLFCVFFFYFYNNCSRRRAPVTAAGSQAEHHRGVEFTKIPEFAYSGGDGSQCSVCIGTLQAGEKVRRLPTCEHLYHVECIDMWLASHATCPLCRSNVQPPVDGKAAGTAESPPELPV